MLREAEEGGTQGGKHAWKGDGDQFPTPRSFGCNEVNKACSSPGSWGVLRVVYPVATLILHLPIIPQTYLGPLVAPSQVLIISALTLYNGV